MARWERNTSRSWVRSSARSEQNTAQHKDQDFERCTETRALDLKARCDSVSDQCDFRHEDLQQHRRDQVQAGDEQKDALISRLLNHEACQQAQQAPT